MPGDADQPEAADEPVDGSEPDRLSLERSAVLGMTIVAVIVVVVAHRANPVAALALGGLVVVAGWLSIIDLEQHRLPNRIVGPLALAVTLAVMSGGVWSDDLGRAMTAIVVGVGASVFLLIGNLVGGMGMGDVKYAYPLAATLAWFGAQPVINWAMITFATGGVAALVAIAGGRGRKYRLPYGPFMSIGLIAGLLTAAPGL